MDIHAENSRSGIFIVPWLMLVLALITLGSFIAYSQYLEHERIGEWERTRLSTQAKVINENLARQLNGARLALEGIRRELPQWRGDNGRKTANWRLGALADAMPGIRTLLIANAEGKIIASNRERLIGEDASRRELFQAARRHPDRSTLYVSPPFMTKHGHFVICLSLMIPDQNGNFGGVVSATLDPEYFSILLGSVLYAPDMWAAVAHGDGRQFLMVPERNGMAGMDLAKPGSFFTRHRKIGLTATVMSGIVYATGEERLMALRTIRPDGIHMDKPLVVAVSRDPAALFADWRRETIGKAGLFGVLALVSTVALHLHQLRHRKFEALSAVYEARQREYAERLKLATEAAGVGIWEHDLETDRITWNNVMFSLYGLDPVDVSVAYADWQYSVLPEDLGSTEKTMHKAIQGGQIFDTTFRIRRGDGEVRYIRSVARCYCNEAGKQFRLIGINEDITERKQLEQKIMESERFLKDITDAIPGMVGYWNRDLRCTFANRWYLTRFGISPEDMGGMRMQDFLSVEIFRHNEPFIKKALLGERQEFLMTLTKPDGKVEHVKVHYIPDNGEKQVRGFYVLVTDITELKKAQIKLEELNETLIQRTSEAEQASSSKSRLLAVVAHEFRTPLSLLTSSTDILDRYGERLSKEQRIEQNGHIRSAARQMSALIDSVLSFNSLEISKPAVSRERLNVERTCRAIASEVRTVWGSERDFTVTIPNDCGSAMLDWSLFRRVLENLLTNAFRYTPPGGTVSLHATQEDTSLVLVIKDSGIGIPEEDQQRVFDSFYRGRNVETRRGLGLGLSIVREALSELGGNITLTSRVGAGTEMRVRIPLVHGSAPEEERSCL